jgi:hypothetical protein
LRFEDIDVFTLEAYFNGRVIDFLRKRFPGNWTYDAQYNEWRHESGRKVRAYSQSAQQYDGDESYRTVYRFDDGEPVWLKARL